MRNFREEKEIRQIQNWVTRGGEAEIFSRSQLREAGLVVEGNYLDVQIVSVNSKELPVEPRLGIGENGTTETTFYPRDYTVGKEIILLDANNPST